MLKDSSFYRLYALLRVEVLPRLWTLGVVFLLAALTAVGQKAPILLLEPLFTRVLFTSEKPPGPAVEPSGAFAGLEVAKNRVTDWIFGAPGAAHDRMSAMWTVAAILMALAILAAVSEYGFNWLSRRVALRMVIELRQRLARHLLGLSMRYHGQRSFGDLLSRISNDVTTTLQSVNVLLKDCTQLPLLVLGSLLAAFIAAPAPTMGVVLLLPLIAVPIAVLGRKVRRRSNKSLSSLGASVEVLTQMFTGIRTVKAFRAEERELDRYRRINEDYMRTSMKMVRAIASIEASTALLSNLGLAVLLVLIIWLNETFHWFPDPGKMSGFVVGIALVYGHVKRLSNAVGKVQESAGASERLQALFDEPRDIVEHANAKRATGLGRGIAFEDVTFSYPTGDVPAINQLTLRIRPGETLALVGASGAGKTTLVDLIARFIDPTAGRITVDGTDLRELALDSWTDLYAMVGQTPFLFHTSILDNIRYGKHDATEAEVEAAARAANIHDFIAGLPEGYATMAGDAGARLSGGQRQRITIARAILKGAPLLLLDEATSALDSESEKVVQEALDRLVRDRTVIVIAHRLSTIRNADRIAVLDHGRLVEIGSHAELLERRGAYARLYAAQFQAGAEVVA